MSSTIEKFEPWNDDFFIASWYFSAGIAILILTALIGFLTYTYGVWKNCFIQACVCFFVALYIATFFLKKCNRLFKRASRRKYGHDVEVKFQKKLAEAIPPGWKMYTAIINPLFGDIDVLIETDYLTRYVVEIKSFGGVKEGRNGEIVKLNGYSIDKDVAKQVLDQARHARSSRPIIWCPMSKENYFSFSRANQVMLVNGSAETLLNAINQYSARESSPIVTVRTQILWTSSPS